MPEALKVFINRLTDPWLFISLAGIALILSLSPVFEKRCGQAGSHFGSTARKTEPSLAQSGISSTSTS